MSYFNKKWNPFPKYLKIKRASTKNIQNDVLDISKNKKTHHSWEYT